MSLMLNLKMELECEKSSYVYTFVVERNAINGGYARLW